MRTMFIAAACAAILLAPTFARAQGADNYPSKPVMIIIPTVPGNVTDKETRLWNGKVSESLGQQFVFDYKPGAGGTLGARAGAQAKPDGYTLGMVILNITQQRLRFQIQDLGFDPINSFEFIS